MTCRGNDKATSWMSRVAQISDRMNNSFQNEGCMPDKCGQVSQEFDPKGFVIPILFGSKLLRRYGDVTTRRCIGVISETNGDNA